MINSTQSLLDRLAAFLAVYRYYLEFKSNARLLDVAILGEPLARDLAEIVFGYTDLVNLNLGTSFPSIDLGSTVAACAIQVTISGSATKIIETQRKFFEHGLDRTYSSLRFIILGDKQETYKSKQIIRATGTFNFDPDKDIFDLKDLFNLLVATSDQVKIEAFYKRLENELGSAIRPYVPNADRPGQNLRRLFDAHDVTTTDAVQSLRSFGMSREIFSNTVKIAEVSNRELIEYVAEQFWVSGEWIEGRDTHIYSGVPGLEAVTDWRRSVRGAYDLVARASVNGETLDLIIPVGPSLCELDAREDVIDHKERDYEHFFLVARKTNDFSVERFRHVICDPLSYQKCRDGIFLLFVAAEIYEIETRQKTYIHVYHAPREQILSCYHGESFLVDLHRSAQLVDNHKDFVSSVNGKILTTTRKVPHRLTFLLKMKLAEFVDSHSSSLSQPFLFVEA